MCVPDPESWKTWLGGSSPYSSAWRVHKEGVVLEGLSGADAGCYDNRRRVLCAEWKRGGRGRVVEERACKGSVMGLAGKVWGWGMPLGMGTLQSIGRSWALHSVPLHCLQGMHAALLAGSQNFAGITHTAGGTHTMGSTWENHAQCNSPC